jgi:site-specific DNA-methyltransferase (adenine-specific)
VRTEVIATSTLHLADCREVLPDLRFDVVVTDPPWDQARNIDGADDPRGLFAAVADHLTRARCIAIQLGCYTDPAFCAPIASKMPFLHACWLRYVPASYRGRILVEADIAYVYGSAPKSVAGRRVLPAMCISTSREPSEREMRRSHGRNRSAAAARDTAAAMPHPMPRHLKHVRWLAEWHSDADEIVCDPFMGSGTAGVACASLGRPFVGVESDPEFFDIACRRVEQAHKQQRLFAPPFAIRTQREAEVK